MTSKEGIDVLIGLVDREDAHEIDRYSGMRIFAAVRDWEALLHVAQLREPDWILIVNPTQFLPAEQKQALEQLISGLDFTRIALIDADGRGSRWRGLPVAIFPTIKQFCRFATYDMVQLHERPQKSEEYRTFHTPDGQVICALSIKGGVGKTFVACNLAIHMAELYPQQVVLIDLDTGSSDVAYKLNLPLQSRLPDLITQLNDYADRDNDITDLEPFLVQYKRVPLWVLTGPEHPELGQIFTTEMVRNIIRWCRKRFRWTIIDTSPHPGHPLLTPVIEASNECLVISTPELSALRQANLVNDLLDRHSDDSRARQRKHFILNRLDRENEVSLREAEQLLDVRFQAILPEMKRLVIRSAAEGKPIIFQPEAKEMRAAMDSLHMLFTGNDGSLQLERGKNSWTRKLSDLWSRLPV